MICAGMAVAGTLTPAGATLSPKEIPTVPPATPTATSVVRRLTARCPAKSMPSPAKPTIGHSYPMAATMEACAAWRAGTYPATRQSATGTARQKKAMSKG